VPEELWAMQNTGTFYMMDSKEAPESGLLRRQTEPLGQLQLKKGASVKMQAPLSKEGTSTKMQERGGSAGSVELEIIQNEEPIEKEADVSQSKSVGNT